MSWNQSLRNQCRQASTNDRVSMNKLEVTNPFDHSHVGAVPVAGWDKVDMMLGHASKAFLDRKQRLSVSRRMEILENSASIMQQRFDHLALLIASEGGKPIARLISPRGLTPNALHLAAIVPAFKEDGGDQWLPNTTASEASVSLPPFSSNRKATKVRKTDWARVSTNIVRHSQLNLRGCLIPHLLSLAPAWSAALVLATVDG